MAERDVFRSFQSLYSRGFSRSSEYGAFCEALENMSSPVNAESKSAAQLLDTVGNALQDMLQNDVPGTSQALKLFADLLRNHEDWRLPIGTSRVFQVALEVIKTESTSDSKPVQEQALRLVGNSVADNDDVRAVLTASPASVRALVGLLDGPLGAIALSVLYNLSLDYPLAQKELVVSKCLPTLIRSQFVIDGNTLACELLEAACTNATASEKIDDSTRLELLKICCRSSETDQFSALTNAALSLLSSPRFLEDTAHFEVYVETAEKACESMRQMKQAGAEAATNEEYQAIIQALYTLISKLYEFTAADEFAEPLESKLVKHVSDSLSSLSNSSSPIKSAAYLITLANMIRDNTFATEMVNKSLHIQAIRTIKDELNSTNKIVAPVTIHAALQFLGQTAIASTNKPKLVTDGTLTILLPILQKNSAFSDEIHINALTILRRLIAGSIEYIYNFISSTDSLQTLIGLFQTTDKPPLKLEIARLIAETCRTIGLVNETTEERKDQEQLQQQTIHLLLKSNYLADPLTFAAVNASSPGAKTEAWFAMGILISWGNEGKQAVAKALERNEEVRKKIMEESKRVDDGVGTTAKKETGMTKEEIENLRVVVVGLADKGVSPSSSSSSSSLMLSMSSTLIKCLEIAARNAGLDGLKFQGIVDDDGDGDENAL